MTGTRELKQDLIEKGMLKVVSFGDAELACVSEKDIFQEVTNRIQNNPYSFVMPYTDADLTKEYTFGRGGKRVTHC